MLTASNILERSWLAASRRRAALAGLCWAVALAVSACGIPRAESPTPAVETAAPVAASSAAEGALAPAPVSPLPAEAAGSVIGLEAGPQTFVSRELVSMRRISQGPNGEPSDGPASSVAMSVDGRIFAYASAAENLAPGDAGAMDDVFVYDAETGAMERISAGPDGAAADGWSSGPAVSADGRFVAFYSWAGNLSPGDTNTVQDLFVYDRMGRSLQRISRAPDGSQANDRSGDNRAGARPALSANGSVIAFHSRASNLVDLDTNGREDVFVYDAALRRTTLVSVSSDGAQADGDARDPALSADGRVVAFSSRARLLDADAPNPAGASQIFVHDRVTGRTRLVSTSADGHAGNGDSFAAALSGDGETVVFASDASNLVEDDANGATDVFLIDLTTGDRQRISVSSAGTEGNGGSTAPGISLDGRYVAFASVASNLVNGDSNGAADVFVFDRLTRHTALVSAGVLGTWTGVQANDDSLGPPAVAAGGRLIAFVSAATNLVQGEPPLHAEVYALERTDLPAFRVQGRVLDEKNRPVADVTVAAGPHRAVTGADGRYAFDHVPGGTYTVIPSRDGGGFSPAQRTLSVVADASNVDFRAVSNGGGRLSFLSLPFAGEHSTSDFLAALRDSDEGGWVDAWFDHDAPDKSKNQAVRLWDGRARDTGFFNSALGCYERRCYDGHDGTDFPYRDPIPATAAYEPLLVHAAATGMVAHTHESCAAGDRWCNRGYGNEVILLHDNGYFTRYAHLASIESVAQSRGVRLDAGDALGVMGSTGNSFGAHLHFAVHQDDGNGRWDGEEQDAPVDPFGWLGPDADPWAEAAAGATSRWMWNEQPTVERLLFGNHGGDIQDQTGTITVRIPPGALSGQVRLEMESGAAAAAPAPSSRSLGRPFRLTLLDWYAPAGQAPAVDALQDAALALPFEIALSLDPAGARYLDLERAVVMRWDEAAARWQPLPTAVEQGGALVRATSDRLGQFDAQAPLRCAGDAFEPDDQYFAAIYVEPGDAAVRRLFDSEADVDWVRFPAAAGQGVRVQVDALAEGVAFSVEIHDVDGLTRLVTVESVDGQPALLAWSAPDEGDYFVRVAPTPGSRAGCDAAYSLTLD